MPEQKPLRALGEAIAEARPAFDKLRQAVEQRRVEFLARGGRCVVCWDTGVVPAVVAGNAPVSCTGKGCEAGLARRQSEAQRAAALLIQTSGAGRYDLTLATHPNRALVEHVTDWADRSWLSALKRREKLATGGDDPFLLLYGATGVGKSQIAAALLRRAIQKGAGSARFVSIVKLLNLLRKGSSDDDQARGQKMLTDAVEAEAVVLDDLGRDPCTEWVSRILYRIIDERYTERRWTIITTNRDPNITDPADRDGMTFWLDDALYYRIMERADVVNCGGEERNLRV